MSRPVTLIGADGTTVLGNVNLPSDYPSTPGVLVWKGNAFVAGDISYSPAPGAYESYMQTDALTISNGDVSAPDVAPTNPA